MIVFVVDTLGIFAGECERHPPIAADLDRPSAFPSTLQFMEAQTGQVHVLRVRRRVERAQNQTQSIVMLGLNASLGASGEALFETFVPKAPNRHRNQCNVYGYRSQSG